MTDNGGCVLGLLRLLGLAMVLALATGHPARSPGLRATGIGR